MAFVFRKQMRFCKVSKNRDLEKYLKLEFTQKISKSVIAFTKPVKLVISTLLLGKDFFSFVFLCNFHSKLDFSLQNDVRIFATKKKQIKKLENGVN